MKDISINTLALQRFISIILIIALAVGLLHLNPKSVKAESSAEIVTFNPIVEDQGAYNGQPISDIAPNSSYVAIKSVDDQNGQWQWFNGTQWLNITDRLSLGSPLVLPANTLIRFSATPNWNGLTTINYVHYIEGSTNPNDLNNYEETVRTAQLTVTPVDDAPYLTEAGGNNYLSFSKNGAYATYPSMDIYSQSFTFESWVKIPYRMNAWERIFDTSFGMDNFNLHLAFEGGTGKMVLEALPQRGYRLNTYQARTAEAFPINTWVHVAVVYNHNQKQANIYWNGVLKGQGYMDLSNMSNAGLQNGGIQRPINYLSKSTWDQDGYFKGGMKQVRFWNKAKLQSEIINHMNKELVQTEPNLLVQYQFNEGTGETASSTGGITIPSRLISTTWMTDDGFIYGVTGKADSTLVKEFNVFDVDAGDVDRLSVSAVSSNQTVLANNAIRLAGTSSNRMIIMRPIEEGSSTITVTLNDGVNTYQSSFLLTVTSLPPGEQLEEPTIPDQPGEEPVEEPTTPDQPGGEPVEEPTAPDQPGGEPAKEPTTPDQSGIQKPAVPNGNSTPGEQTAGNDVQKKLSKTANTNKENNSATTLPDTATSQYNIVTAGLLIVGIGLLMIFLTRQKRKFE
ncbi:LamG domain-containing protein [Neobacillus niacini]|uniref:LamG domain-containing protein n=1 Tax=Neobacillus niacini TaxID=86668 RepID=UPI0021CB91F0|nr:LamG-like jellyroll fold domain-containing protein [Neobacillus niacini]MCM3763880.1 LPXTG cell wall anchor domain-containing protein [Neobacillus niacini]